MLSYFDTLFATAATPLLDAVFAGPLEYRAQGQNLSIMGTLAAQQQRLIEQQGIADNWQAETVELATSELVLVDGTPFLPIGGHEIAYTLSAGGRDVYIVTNGPEGRPYAWLDPDHQRLIVYCKFIRTET